MDLLHKKLASADDILFFIVSSVEEPYYFIRLKGQVKEITSNDEYISYRIQLLEILEPTSIIRGCMSNKHFRFKCIGKKRSPYIDKKIRTHDLDDKDLQSGIIKRLNKSLFDVSIMTTYETFEDMNSKLEFVNRINIDKLSSRIDFLSHRSLMI